MPPPQIAVATRSFRQPLRNSMKTAADLGAHGIQLDARDELTPQALSDTGRRQFLHQLDSLGLKVASLTFPTRRSFYDDDQLDTRVGATKAAMQFARQLGSTVLTIRVGRIPPEPDSKDYRLLCEVLTDLAHHGNHVGVTPSIIPTHDAPQKLQELVSAVRSGPLGVDFDPAEFVATGERPDAAYRMLYSLVSHFTARDAIRKGEGGSVETALGQGAVDWIALLPLLHESNYRGWITVDRTQGDDRLGDVGRAVKYLREVLV